MTLLELASVEVRRGGVTRVAAASFEVEAGQVFGVIGPNGSGKSSLLKAIAQLLPHTGRVRVSGSDACVMDATTRARRIAYLAQDGEAAWPLHVRDFVALGRLPHGRRDPGGEAAIDAALRQMHLQALATCRIDQLSGGERARARLARALAVEAPLLLADEPIAALDPFHQLSVMELLHQQRGQGRAIVMVLHDLTLASRFCDRVALMDRGQVVACGTPRLVLTSANLQRVYQVQAMHGEHDSEPYIVPWRCQPAAAGAPPARTLPSH